MERIIYLDNSATTKPCEAAVSAVDRALRDTWGNPSSLHDLGVGAQLAVDEARKAVSGLLCCRADEIVFTGGGTEANNLAIFGSADAMKRRGNKIVTSSIEHPSVLEPMKRLEQQGFEIVRLTPDINGVIKPEALENAIDGKTVLVSIMMVNNETGAIQPLKTAADCIKRSGSPALLHCDAVQAFGKMKLNPQALGIDLMSASGHKIHAPKGVGILYHRKSVHISPVIYGGGQEYALRSGTEPVPLICGLRGAVEALGDIGKRLENQQELFDYAVGVLSALPFIKLNSAAGGLPYVLNISVPGFRSETLLHFLEQRNIFVSGGSACAKGQVSYVLKEMGLSKEDIDGALRISFCRDNVQDDVDKLADALNTAVKSLKRAY